MPKKYHAGRAPAGDPKPPLFQVRDYNVCYVKGLFWDRTRTFGTPPLPPKSCLLRQFKALTSLPEMTLTTEVEHHAAVQEFRALATDEETNHARLQLLRDAIHAFEEASGHRPGPPSTAVGRRQVELFRRQLKQP